jgi:hypothetical protein
MCGNACPGAGSDRMCVAGMCAMAGGKRIRGAGGIVR